jgi:murein L,D-transpeptidase YafK
VPNGSNVVGSRAGWQGAVGWSALALAVLLSGCALGAKDESTASAAPAPEQEHPSLDWAASEDYFVLVQRSCRTVSVYRRGKWMRTYENVSFGRMPGVKQYQGDKKTPAGLYKIVGRRVHPRWSRFLLLDYPNRNDRENHPDPGGEIGIHGSDEPILNNTGVDWTLGCVSLLNDDVKDFYKLVPDGTLVWIEE